MIMQAATLLKDYPRSHGPGHQCRDGRECLSLHDLHPHPESDQTSGCQDARKEIIDALACLPSWTERPVEDPSRRGFPDYRRGREWRHARAMRSLVSPLRNFWLTDCSIKSCRRDIRTDDLVWHRSVTGTVAVSTSSAPNWANMSARRSPVSWRKNWRLIGAKFRSSHC